MSNENVNGYLLYGDLKGVELLNDNLIVLTFYKYSQPEITVNELRKLAKGTLSVYFKKLQNPAIGK